MLKRDVFFVIGDAVGSGSASSVTVGGGGGRGTVPFLRVAPLSYPQPGSDAGIVPGKSLSYSGRQRRLQ
jgi:hypothetical protein